jgi:hypothetical protein
VSDRDIEAIHAIRVEATEAFENGNFDAFCRTLPMTPSGC